MKSSVQHFESMPGDEELAVPFPLTDNGPSINVDASPCIFSIDANRVSMRFVAGVLIVTLAVAMVVLAVLDADQSTMLMFLTIGCVSSIFMFAVMDAWNRQMDSAGAHCIADSAEHRLSFPQLRAEVPFEDVVAVIVIWQLFCEPYSTLAHRTQLSVLTQTQDGLCNRYPVIADGSHEVVRDSACELAKRLNVPCRLYRLRRTEDGTACESEVLAAG